MGTPPTDELTFDPSDLSAVSTRVRMILVAERGGWVNLGPAVDEEVADALRPSAVGRFFSARGPMIPMATVVAPDAGGRRRRAGSLGIEHPGGPKAAETITDAGVTVPRGLTQRQDHPRHGLVYEIGDGFDVAALVAFAIAATEALTEIALPEVWIARVYEPS